MTPLIRGASSSQIYWDKKWNSGCQEMGGKRNEELVFNGGRISIREDGKIL